MEQRKPHTHTHYIFISISLCWEKEEEESLYGRWGMTTRGISDPSLLLLRPYLPWYRLLISFGIVAEPLVLLSRRGQTSRPLDFGSDIYSIPFEAEFYYFRMRLTPFQDSLQLPIIVGQSIIK